MAEILHESWCTWQPLRHNLRLPAHESHRYAAGMDKKTALLKYRRQVGNRLAEARIKAGLTQAQAAAELTERGYKNRQGGPLEPSRIGNYEQGSRLPDPMLVQDLCAIYGDFPSRIYGFEEAPQNKEEASLTIKYRLTDDRGKRNVRSVADAQPGYGVTPGESEEAG